MPKTFADVLREQLEIAGITPYRLSQISGVSKASISKILNGQIHPSWDSAQKIIKALGVSCEVFMTEVELPDAPDERGRGRPSVEGEGGQEEEGESTSEVKRKRKPKGKGK